jgi:hypothetical protein
MKKEHKQVVLSSLNLPQFHKLLDTLKKALKPPASKFVVLAQQLKARWLGAQWHEDTCRSAGSFRRCCGATLLVKPRRLLGFVLIVVKSGRLNRALRFGPRLSLGLVVE